MDKMECGRSTACKFSYLFYSSRTLPPFLPCPQGKIVSFSMLSVGASKLSIHYSPPSRQN